jgi:hypothetical protein
MKVRTLKMLNTGSLRTVVVACCIVASAAILVHHGVPSMEMPGMSSVETCVSVAAHAVEAPVAPAILMIAVAGAVLLLRFSLGMPVRSTRSARARAGPSELGIPLRC